MNVKIELTKAELKALLTMASEVAEHGDAMRQVFPNGRQRKMAEEVYEYLRMQISPTRKTAK